MLSKLGDFSGRQPGSPLCLVSVMSILFEMIQSSFGNALLVFYRVLFLLKPDRMEGRNRAVVTVPGSHWRSFPTMSPRREREVSVHRTSRVRRFDSQGAGRFATKFNKNNPSYEPTEYATIGSSLLKSRRLEASPPRRRKIRRSAESSRKENLLAKGGRLFFGRTKTRGSHQRNQTERGFPANLPQA
jgi:hypothetical protein